MGTTNREIPESLPPLGEARNRTPIPNKAYNTFALSTLLYIAQLEKPPSVTLQAEIQGLGKVIKGPYQWAHTEDLWRLKEHYGQTKSCKSLTHTAIAAKLRVGK